MYDIDSTDPWSIDWMYPTYPWSLEWTDPTGPLMIAPPGPGILKWMIVSVV